MKRVATLTDFLNFDPAYSLCRVVQAQIRMLKRGGYAPRLLVRQGFEPQHIRSYEGVETIALDHGKTGSNTVEINEASGVEINTLTEELRRALDGIDVVLTHDLIYQPNCWKAHVAARRVANTRPDLRWLHWVHSASNMAVRNKVGPFREELLGIFPNARLVAMHRAEVDFKGALYGYERDQIAVIPNPIDFLEGCDPLTRKAVDTLNLMNADVIAVYPCRLDRGKQPHLIVDVFAELRKLGADARMVLVDFHSVAEDKLTYRNEIRARAANCGVPILFTSDLEGTWGGGDVVGGAPYNYCVPHRAVMELFEIGDVLVHPSMSESDPLVLYEAEWKRCGLVLNARVGVFGLYQGQALLYNFPEEAAAIVAAGIAYQMRNNPLLALHAQARKERSLEGVWPVLKAAIEGA